MKSSCKPRFWRWPSWACGGDFRRRAGSALTHPVTVAALGVLLLNDLLLKALWPQAWLTGKLSDLAWVVFALPLLAFLLSFVARGGVRAHRLAFLTAYVGLPVLYATFNAFDPVHDWIMRGMSLAGGAAGSPRDATDSLVIPLAWGAALWVWRREPAAPGAMRLRWAVLVVCFTSFAIGSPSCDSEPQQGVHRIGVSGDGAIIAEAKYSTLQSIDGGITWSVIQQQPGEVVWGGKSVDTPRGRYSLDGPHVLRSNTEDTQEMVVYSTEHLSESGNVWVQKVSTAKLDRLRQVATRPLGIVYDRRSDNVVLALGLQGVVVDTPDGGWVAVAADRYAPTDFSFLGKSRLLLSDLGFWAANLSLCLAMTGAALTVSQHRREELLRSIPVAALIGFGVLVVVSVIALPPLFLVSILSQSNPAAVGVVLLAFSLGAGFVIGALARRSEFWNLAVIGIGVLATVAAVALIAYFGGSDDNLVNDPVVGYRLYGILILLVALTSLTFSRHLLLKHWIVTGCALAISTALLVLAFMFWLHLGIGHAPTKIAAIAISGGATFLLWRHVSRVTHVEGPACPACMKPTTALYTGCTNCGAKLAED